MDFSIVQSFSARRTDPLGSLQPQARHSFLRGLNRARSSNGGTDIHEGFLERSTSTEVGGLLRRQVVHASGIRRGVLPVDALHDDESGLSIFENHE